MGQIHMKPILHSKCLAPQIVRSVENYSLAQMWATLPTSQCSQLNRGLLLEPG